MLVIGDDMNEVLLLILEVLRTNYTIVMGRIQDLMVDHETFAGECEFAIGIGALNGARGFRLYDISLFVFHCAFFALHFPQAVR